MTPTNLPAPIPPCSTRGERIEAVYAARFIIVPWESLSLAAEEAFPERDPSEILQLLTRASSGGCEPGEKAELEAVYRKLLTATELMAEESNHHQDLAGTYCWGLINGVGLCERLQVVRAQTSPGAVGAWGRRVRRRALFRAAELHLFRRYLFVQLSPVVELLHVLKELEFQSSATRTAEQLNALADRLSSGPVGKQAARVLEMVWQDRLSNAGDRDLESRHLQTAARSALREDIVTPRGWETALANVISTVAGGQVRSRSLDHLLSRANASPSDQVDDSLTLPGFLLRYLWHTSGDGLVFLLARLMLGRFGRSLGPFLRALLSSDPYASRRDSGPDSFRDRSPAELHSIPALRALAGDKNVIIDPVAIFASRQSDRVNHPGIENMLPGLWDHHGYVVDHLLVRRAMEHFIEPGRRWSRQLEAFILRWAGVKPDDKEYEFLRALLDRIDRHAKRVADDLSSIAASGSQPTRLSGSSYQEHETARKLLLEPLETRQVAGSQALFHLLHAYYIHGL